MLAHLVANQSRRRDQKQLPLSDCGYVLPPHSTFINHANDVSNNNFRAPARIQMETTMGYQNQRVPALIAASNERHQLNGERIIYELKDFCTAIEKSIGARGVKTVMRTANTAWVYMEGEDMAMGWVGYGDFQTSRTARDNKYAVYARDIRNMKYNDMNDQHFMRVALKMDVALKHAKAYLRNYSTWETAEALSVPVRRDVDEVRKAAQRAYQVALETVGIGSRYAAQAGPLLQELGYMVLSGHTFTSPELGANIQDMLNKKKVSARFKNDDAVPMDFVRVYTTSYGEQRVDTVRVKDITNYRREIDTDHNRTWLAKELPEELMGKIAVMAMCQDAEFVEDVGFKVSDNMFYLYVEDVTT